MSSLAEKNIQMGLTFKMNIFRESNRTFLFVSSFGITH